MSEEFIPHRYQPQDWVDVRTGDALKRDEALKKMLRDQKDFDDDNVVKLYENLFEYTAKGMFEDRLGSVSPNLNVDYLHHTMDIVIWENILGHRDDGQEMPFSQKSSWLPSEMIQRPWSVRYGMYFDNRAFLDGEGGHVTQPDGAVLKHKYALKEHTRQAESKKMLELEIARAQAETARAQAEMARAQAETAKLETRKMEAEARVAERNAATAV